MDRAPFQQNAQQWLWIPRSSLYYEVSASTVSSTACSHEVRAYSDSMRACTAFLKKMQALTANWKQSGQTVSNYG